MRRALVIGGGIAGTATAMALRSAGLQPTVYEAYDRTADGVGAFLTLAVNGLHALRCLGLDHVVGGFNTPQIAMFSGTGRRLAELSLGGELPDGTVSRTVARAELYVALRDEAVRRGIPVEYGRRLVDVQHGDGIVRAVFADGSEAEGDLLVGADGLHSRVRTLLDPAAKPPRYVGLLNAGGYARGVDAGVRTGETRMVFGRRCFLGYVGAPDGSVWWFANPPQATEPSRAELATITEAQWRDRLVDLLAVDRTPGAALVRATDRLMGPWPTHDVPDTEVWHRDRMVLVGDAAHATSPASGQGASMAFEDAVVLGHCLHDATDIDAAFAAFERARRDRVQRVVAMGKRNGDGKATGPLGRVLRDALLPVFLRRQARNPEAMSWLYDHRLDEPAIPEVVQPA